MVKHRYLMILFLTLIGFIFFESKVKSQAPTRLFSNISIASPNAASLGKYGDFPVGYNTGLPQINIPIYTVKEGPLSLPISISYHASGLKVMEAASSVGTGWSLNAGGVITRTVVGAPDDRGHLSNTQFGHFSNYGYNSYLLDPTSTTGTGTCYSFPEGNMGAFKDNDFSLGIRDGEPDLFFFNFGGYSGKFYFRDDRTPVLVPEGDFKIEPIVVNIGDNITGFIITTPDGIKYYFGKNQNTDNNIDATETTNPYTSANGLSVGNVFSSWYLNKIKSADGKFFIDLIYQPEKYSYYTISMFPTTSDQINNYCTLVKNYMDGVKLSGINFSNGNIKFLSGSVRTDLGEYQTKTISDLVNTDSKSLDTIQVTANSGVCKNYILFHSYFVDNTNSLARDLTGGLTITTDSKRLKLDSIQEKTCDGSFSVPPYKFTYSSPSLVPRRLTFGVDHWGFYNGKVNNTTLIPTYTVNDFENHNGADRESSWPESGYGTLNNITYPTGGNTQFIFEQNEIWANYNYYNDSYQVTSNIGPYIGVTQTQTINLTTSANKYRIVLDYKTNQYGTSVGSASIAGISVNKANPHNEIVITPGIGPHTYYLSQLDMTSANSDWATAVIYEIVPTNFQNNKVVGGVRISSIRNYDVITNNDIATTYNYRSGGRSNGVLYSRPTYIQVLRNDIYRQVGLATLPSCSPNGCLNCDISLGYQLSPNSLFPMQTIQGNHIGYNNVEVSQTGNGKTVYQYYGSDIWDQNQNDVSIRNVNNTVCAVTIPNYPAAPLPYEFMRGELKYEAHYNQAGVLLKDIFYYPVFVNNPITTPAYINSSANSGAATLYNLTTAKKTQSTVISTYYPTFGAPSISKDSSFYESPYHHQLTRTSSTNSLGERIETKIKYAFDFRVPNCEAISDCFQAYNTSYTNALNTFNNAINTCTSSGTCNCKYPAFQSYRYQWSVARINYVNCRRTNFIDSGNVFTTNHNNAKAVADAEFKPVLELQDRYINVPIETTVWKAGNLISASYNKYDFATNPAGNVYPSKLQEIKTASPSSAFTISTTTNTNLYKDSRYADETTVQFDNGVLVKVVPKSGLMNTYIWDYKLNQPIAITTNADISDIAATSFEADGTGNWSGIVIANILKETSGSVTGNNSYTLSGTTISKTVSGSKIYLVSYWSKNGSYNVNGTVARQGKTINIGGQYWTYFEHDVTGPATILVSGTGIIDELRIYPKNAQMTTYTYSGLFDIASMCDGGNRITYYEYDGMGRLQVIRDQDKNVVKKICYNYSGVDACPSSGLINVSLTYKNNASLTGFTVRYTNKSTGAIYQFPIPSIFYATPQPLGSIPPGLYDIYFSNPANTSPYIIFGSGCTGQTITGVSATFYNININSTVCNSIFLDTTF